MTSGLAARRSTEQAVVEVMLEAIEDISVEHDCALAEQEASRVWVMRTRDLEAWKKELEFCGKGG